MEESHRSARSEHSCDVWPPGRTPELLLQSSSPSSCQAMLRVQKSLLAQRALLEHRTQIQGAVRSKASKSTGLRAPCPRLHHSDTVSSVERAHTGPQAGSRPLAVSAHSLAAPQLPIHSRATSGCKGRAAGPTVETACRLVLIHAGQPCSTEAPGVLPEGLLGRLDDVRRRLHVDVVVVQGSRVCRRPCLSQQDPNPPAHVFGRRRLPGEGKQASLS